MKVFLLLTVEGHNWAIGLVLGHNSKFGHRIWQVFFVLFDVLFGDFKLLEMIMKLERMGRQSGNQFPDRFSIVISLAATTMNISDIKIMLQQLQNIFLYNDS